MRDGPMARRNSVCGFLGWFQADSRAMTPGPATELRMFPDATKQVVEPAGLREVQVINVGPHHYAAIFEKT